MTNKDPFTKRSRPAKGPAPDPSAASHERRLVALLCLALASITLIVYSPVRGHDYITFDDPDFVSANPHVLDGLTWDNVKWAFQPGHGDYWHPLTWLSLMLDVSVLGADPGGLHVVNVFLHAANAVLLFLLLRGWTGALWPAAFVAGLFAWHPMHVEAVAWVTARKDVLSTLFWLLTLWAYGKYAGVQIRNPPAKRDEIRNPKGEGRSARSKGFLWLALLFFVLGLMSKAMLMTLPFVLLLLDWWPLGRCEVRGEVRGERGEGRGARGEMTSKSERSTLSSLLIEKLPFFALSLGSCALTYWGQHRVEVVVPMLNDSFGHRVASALVAYWRYLVKTVWPAHLAISYPRPEHWPWLDVAVAAAAVTGLSALAFWLKRRRPYVFVGWFWFVGTLVPVIGLTKNWSQFMADRFTYVPLIGLFIIAAWAIEEVRRAKCEGRSEEAGSRFPGWCRVLFAVPAVILAACSWQTHHQVNVWRDTETLFRHAAAVTKDNDFAYEIIGGCLTRRGLPDEAIEWCRKALAINPRRSSAHNNLASALTQRGNFDEAIAQCHEAMRLDPGAAGPLINLGYALSGKGDLAGAMDAFRGALRLDPDSAVAHNNLAFMHAKAGQGAEAEREYRAAIRCNPHYPDACNNLAGLLFRDGRVDEAIELYGRAIGLAPRAANLRNNLGFALASKGRVTEAIECYRKALELDPGSLETHNNLGSLLAQQGDLQGAVDHFQASLHLKPDQAEVHLHLASVLVQLHREPEARAHIEEAGRLRPEFKGNPSP